MLGPTKRILIAKWFKDVLMCFNTLKHIATVYIYIYVNICTYYFIVLIPNLDDDQNRLILMLSWGRETINFFQISSFEAIRQGDHNILRDDQMFSRQSFSVFTRNFYPLVN